MNASINFSHFKFTIFVELPGFNLDDMNRLVSLFGFLTFFTASCETADIDKKNEKPIVLETEEDLVEIMPNMYREYFPGKKQIKIMGPLDNEGRRHGAWESFYENGKKNSATYYIHGVKNGHSIVYHPNGNVYYYGEYLNDEKVGVWRTYNEKGELISEDEF